ncbi:MAG: hypothetical protein NC348_10795 [Clostridium sp.]|nr:hypothetical protein [Clostridium sp.]
MGIDKINAEDLRYMKGKEGLVLQGCGGDPQEWVDGINDMLTEAGILLDGTKFEQVSVFENAGLTCILYPFAGVKLSEGKLAVWRLQTHGEFGGTWLSDYVPNRLGGFIKAAGQKMEKPDCALIGEDGNIFNLAGIAANTLRTHGMEKQADEMKERILDSGSYEAALNIIGEYVNFTGKWQETDNHITEPEEPGRSR